jgi:transposase
VGINCIIVNPADIPGTDKEQKSKTDKVDARKLAVYAASGLLNPIHVPTEKLQKQRSLIRLRKKIWGDLVRAKNRLKGELRFQGYIVPEKYDIASWSNNFLLWIEQLAMRDENIKDTFLMMLDEVKALRQLLLKAEKRLRDLMRTEEFRHDSDLLRSIPGVGPLTSMLFLLEVGDVRRFRSFDALNRYVGLCPDSHSSGEKLRNTGLSSRSHNQLRSALVEASWQLIRRDVAMFNHYKDLQKRMKGQEAIIRIARKLLRRIRAVLLSNRIYVSGIDEKITAKELNAPNLPIPKLMGRPRKISEV